MTGRWRCCRTRAGRSAIRRKGWRGQPPSGKSANHPGIGSRRAPHDGRRTTGRRRSTACAPPRHDPPTVVQTTMAQPLMKAGEMLAAPPRREAPPPPPCAMVIFGAGGDLTKRLLVPALYNLARTGLLPADFALVGVDLAEMDTAGWRASLRTMMQEFVGRSGAEDQLKAIDETVWNGFSGRMSYLRGDLTDQATYRALGTHLAEVSGTAGTQDNCLFYLAVADRFFEPVHWRRVVIEKPLGHDLTSAQELNARILQRLTEDKIYRIDHFLGKETVQNIMALRF